MWIREGHGAREIHSSVDQTDKVKTKKILAIFHEFFGDDPKKGLRPKTFMKSGVSPQKLRKYGR